MVIYFVLKQISVFAISIQSKPEPKEIEKINWLLGGAEFLEKNSIEGSFVGPRKEMITPWCTNAIEIMSNMGLKGIDRIEMLEKVDLQDAKFDPMLQAIYINPAQDIFDIHRLPEAVVFVEDIAAYNQKEGLALSQDEIEYLDELSRKIKRPLSDSEVFGFSQVNSEHCRHKIFNGTFIIDGIEKESSLFALIKKTAKEHPNFIVSAYSDNVAFIEGPVAIQFAPKRQDVPDYFQLKKIETVISLKAETHNFPTTVEPFNGAATGSGGEIRDRMAGGIGSIPIAGTAVYMTSYPRLKEDRKWESYSEKRKWLYHNPAEILIKASNGASDFGNKFGQPLICGSLFTFEHFSENKKWGYDKVIMLAGGIGFARKEHAQKNIPQEGDKLVVLGGDNYRIGMGGGAVSSVSTGEFTNSIELNAVQRSNPEMQKRTFNAIRAMAEMDVNPIVSIHDHGAGGHLNCLSELIETTGGEIDISKLPIGDKTLSLKEIIGNESQERMGLVINEKHLKTLQNIAERERAPIYVVGKIGNNQHLLFKDPLSGTNPIDLDLKDMFGKTPKTIITDTTVKEQFEELHYEPSMLMEYLESLLQMEAVACKDWLTNKVDRSVTGRIALQQCAGEIQLPLNNAGVVALDYEGKKGIATAIGHAPMAALISPKSGSILSVIESLTNIVFCPLAKGLKGVSLSANWMWPCKNKGEDARLYEAVEALSNMACSLGINVPTGKDSLSMTQKYPDGELILSPGTVIVTAVAEVSDISACVTPVIKDVPNTHLLYIDFMGGEFELGGSAFSQLLNTLGTQVPQLPYSTYVINCFNAIQYLLNEKLILAGHDVSTGGLITTLLEMNFASSKAGMEIDLNAFQEKDIIRLLFSEKPAVVIQTQHAQRVLSILKQRGIVSYILGICHQERSFTLYHQRPYNFDIDKLRNIWYQTSYLFDCKQSGAEHAAQRYENYPKQRLSFQFPSHFKGKDAALELQKNRTEKSGLKAAIIREKGVNGDREMAYSLYKAGFDVKDVHMTDLISGRENLTDINMIVFVGGFSNSDVMGSAKGWAGAFLYNEQARKTLENFYKRDDTLSLGVCNGCQLMVELGLITQPEKKPFMQLNQSHKFESGFINVDVQENNSVMLKSLAGSRLGIWVAHGEGMFNFPEEENSYQIPMKYTYEQYPGNPNGSMFNAAAICSEDGRHLAMMPHLERAIFPWQWAHYPENRPQDEITPWIEAFVNARKWVEK